MKKGMMVCGSIFLLIVIVSLLVCAVSVEAIIIDTKNAIPDSRQSPPETSPPTAVRGGFVKPLVHLSRMLVR